MEFLQQGFFNNTLQDWLTALAVGLLSMLALRLLQALVSKRLGKLAARTQTRWDDHVLEMLDGTRMLFWLVTGVWLGSLWLELPGRANAVVQSVFVIALLVQAGLWGQHLVGAVLSDYRRRKLDENPAGVTSLGIINFTAQTLLWSVVVLLILDNLGINVTALVAGLDLPEADLLRRTLQKRHGEGLGALRTRFLDGARNSGVARADAERLRELALAQLRRLLVKAASFDL